LGEAAVRRRQQADAATAPLEAGQLGEDAVLLSAPADFTFGMDDVPWTPGSR
jgi:hypothetical protein